MLIKMNQKLIFLISLYSLLLPTHQIQNKLTPSEPATFFEFSHKCWKKITTCREELDTCLDRVRRIESNSHEGDGDSGSHSLIGVSSEININNNNMNNSYVSDNNKIDLKPDLSLQPLKINILAKLLELESGVTPDDDDYSENEDECLIRTDKLYDAARTSGKFSSDRLKDMKEKAKVECASKLDRGGAKGRENIFRQIWYNIRADSLKYKDQLAIFVKEFKQLRSKFVEKKEYQIKKI
eukprot:c14907_g1_i1.p1 GENE.c14907_g1_i1~~c14907_g1_i1.p1  ORF type:complete len:248 (+),score=73.03 c14907_g1_i1:28-744(+)